MLIRRLQLPPPCKRTREHQHRRLRRMKIRQQTIHHLKLKPRINKYIILARNFPRLRPKLQRPRHRRPHRHHAPTARFRPLNLFQSLLRYPKPLRMHLVRLHLIRANRQKRPQPHMQRQITNLHPLRLQPLNQLLRHIERRCRRRRTPHLLRPHRLIPLFIRLARISMQIRRQRHRTKPLRQLAQILRRLHLG